jgi:gas vesicle protein
MGKLKMGGFVVGGLLGAGVALLLAPKTGKEMRNQLFGGGVEWSEQRDRLMGAVSAGRESATGRSDDLKRKIEETRERLRDQMEE